MITFTKFGNHGRLGNQLFQYAAMIGFADKYNKELVLPEWEYAKCFNGEFPEGKLTSQLQLVKENSFSYEPDRYSHIIPHEASCDMHGYFQTERYWEHCKFKLAKALEFSDDFSDYVYDKCWPVDKGKDVTHPNIAICIRRGDYVDNPNYELLPITYYILALQKHFPNWMDCNLVIISDDIPYCKVHFGCLKNAYFSEGNSDIEDLRIISMCDHMIIGNSSFHWWGAYLGEGEITNTKIIRPAHHFNGKLKEECDIKDFYPKRWIPFDHKNEDGSLKKIDLTDTTFTIPVSYDHNDRKKNLDLSVCMLQQVFATKIIVSEQGQQRFKYMEQFSSYIHFKGMAHFHRTRMLNEMAKLSDTSIIVNWDADIIISPMQILQAVDLIRNGADMVFPYDGRFARMERLKWFKDIERRLDIGIVGDELFPGMGEGDAISVGGAVFFKKESFIHGGKENENFISFGPEDVERDVRFRKLGYKVERIKGTLYHMNHFVGVNSSTKNPFIKKNREERNKIDQMSKEELNKYVNSWPW